MITSRQRRKGAAITKGIAHDVSRQIRDFHGRWTVMGGGSGGHEMSTGQVHSTIEQGQGEWVHRTFVNGARVGMTKHEFWKHGGSKDKALEQAKKTATNHHAAHVHGIPVPGKHAPAPKKEALSRTVRVTAARTAAA